MRSLVAAVGLLLLATPALAQRGQWDTYENARLGVAVDYPLIFVERDPDAANGDGTSFATPDGNAKLKVYGAYNANQDSATDLMEKYKTEGVAYSYQHAARDWLVLSGTHDGTIGYLRCNLGPKDVVGCFEIEYPATDAEKWAAAVERMSKSLRVLPVDREGSQ